MPEIGMLTALENSGDPVLGHACTLSATSRPVQMLTQVLALVMYLNLDLKLPVTCILNVKKVWTHLGSTYT